MTGRDDDDDDDDDEKNKKSEKSTLPSSPSLPLVTLPCFPHTGQLNLGEMMTSAIAPFWHGFISKDSKRVLARLSSCQIELRASD